MNVIVYGTQSDFETCVKHLNAVSELEYRQVNFTRTDVYDDLLRYLRIAEYDLIIITVNGAEGMEGVIASGNLCPDLPKIWITNDPGFGAQSYRLDCVFFGTKPITEKMISNAFLRYRQEKEYRGRA